MRLTFLFAFQHVRNRLSCLARGHAFEHVCITHGDQVISHGYKRSVWRCSRCRRLLHRPDLAS